MEREDFITPESIAKEFGIRKTLAREIIDRETQRAMRRSAFAWCVLACGIGVSGWLFLRPGAEPLSAIMVLVFSVLAWRGTGLYKAEAAVRRAAIAERDAIGPRGP